MAYREAPPTDNEPIGPIDGGVKRRVLEIAGALTVLAAIGAFVYFVFTRDKPPPPIDYGSFSSAVRDLEAELEREPCDRVVTVKLVDLYLQHNNFRGTVERVASFTKKCGEYPPLRRRALDAHRRLNNYDGALADVNVLIAAEPKATDYLYLRAQIHREFGKTAEAIADYQRVLALDADELAALNGIVELSSACDGASAIRSFLKHNADDGLEQRAQLLDKKCGH